MIQRHEDHGFGFHHRMYIIHCILLINKTIIIPLLNLLFDLINKSLSNNIYKIIFKNLKNYNCNVIIVRPNYFHILTLTNQYDYGHFLLVVITCQLFVLRCNMTSCYMNVRCVSSYEPTSQTL